MISKLVTDHLSYETISMQLTKAPPPRNDVAYLEVQQTTSAILWGKIVSSWSMSHEMDRNALFDSMSGNGVTL